MEFSYFDYLTSNLMLPIFALAFIAVPSARYLSRVIANVFRGEKVYLGNFGTLVIIVVLIVAAAILISLLLNGGIHLIYERQNDAVTVQGILEDIHKNSALEGARYGTNGETTFGYVYTVDGNTCTGMAIGTLEEGDEVIVTYLPKSGFVLEINEVG